MEVTFATRELERLLDEPKYSMGLPPAVVQSYRKKMGFILQAKDSRDLRTMKSMALEKLKGKRQHESSIRLNGQFRLVLELFSEDGEQRVHIKSVEDYH